MWIVPTIHPAFVLRNNRRYSGVLKHDFARAISLLHGWRPAWRDEHFAYRPAVDSIEAFCEGAIGRRATVTYDFETDGQHPMICNVRCLGLYDGTHGICIPFLWRKGETGKKANWYEFYGEEDRKRVLAAVGRLLGSPRVTAVAQNGQFDQFVAKARLNMEFKLDNDTMVMHHVAQSYLPHDLGFLGSIYTDICHYKSDEKGAKWSSRDDGQLWTYCLRDAKTTHIVHETLKRELPISYPRAPEIYTIDMRMADICRGMREAGIQVDPAMLAFLRDWYGQKEARALTKMRETLKDVGMKRTDFADLLDIFAKAEEAGTGEGELRPGSLAELRAVFTYLGVPLTAVTGTGLISTEKDFLLEARAFLLTQGAGKNDPRIAFMDYLFAWRECSKVRSTFLDPEVLPDGRVHANFSVHVTPTGRLSGSDPNLQNQPKEIRAIYVAKPGHSIVSWDWDALELRLAALQSGEKTLIGAFDAFDAGRGPKIHYVNAEAIFRRPMAQITEPMYRAAKAFCYAVLYFGGKKTTFEAVHEDDPDMLFGPFVRCYDNFKGARPRLFAWQEAQVKRGSVERHLDSPVLGRRRWFFEAAGDDSPEAAAMVNNGCQSGAADVVTLANFRVVDEVCPRFPSAKQILQVHDELAFEVDDREAQAFAKAAKLVVEVEVIKGWRLPVAVKVEKRWAEAGSGLTVEGKAKVQRAWGKWQEQRA